MEHDHRRGKIRKSKLEAIITSDLFRTRVVEPKKGKGSYKRDNKPTKSDE